jgi:hypothetical protein
MPPSGSGIFSMIQSVYSKVPRDSGCFSLFLDWLMSFQRSLQMGRGLAGHALLLHKSLTFHFYCMRAIITITGKVRDLKTWKQKKIKCIRNPALRDWGYITAVLLYKYNEFFYQSQYHTQKCLREDMFHITDFCMQLV